MQKTRIQFHRYNNKWAEQQSIAIPLFAYTSRNPKMRTYLIYYFIMHACLAS